MAAFEQSPQDEGYSEDPLTTGSMARASSLPAWLVSLRVPEQTELVMSIINQLPTAEVCEIVRRVRPRLYINFFQYLPPEVCLKILEFLDPVSLINTARASHQWMELALDQKLWEDIYALEGFQVISSEVRNFEDELNRPKPSLKHDAAGSSLLFLATLAAQPDADSEMVDAETTVKQEALSESIFGPSSRQLERETSAKRAKLDEDEIMSDRLVSPITQAPKITEMNTSSSTQEPHNSANPGKTSEHSRLSHLSSLSLWDRDHKKRQLNWQYLYSQRRRLEANWAMARYTNFQLPHPRHPEEAHEECVYTIQHSGKFLVSGSRDKTLRVWNLDTGRLVLPPLCAHTGSVLCLQFDADPDEDLIVSGSSDATVVLWRFSTGEVLQKLRKAHRESVLNVRFDKRILVTCSKDKTIKIFNRAPWKSGTFGANFDNTASTHLENYGFNTGPPPELNMKPAYSIVAILSGHSAAVNAVQILGDEIVSASGDRTVKLWNWPTQTCERTFIGHHKGIACVQYDGRRVVSGSSDNEVKVFDKETGLEVASLRAHGSLVRTVQAGFGDNLYSKEKDKEDARRVDEEYFRALENGTVSPGGTKSRSRVRNNAGSWKPENITAYGAQIPPGGGGGRFGRIISGSYDETIIIWRRDKDGAWKAQHTLRQEEGARAAALNPQRQKPSSVVQLSGSSSSQSSPQSTFPASASSSRIDARNFYNHAIHTAVFQGPLALRQAILEHPDILRLAHLQHTIDRLPANLRGPMNQIVNSARVVYEQGNQTPPPEGITAAATTTPVPTQTAPAQISQSTPESLNTPAVAPPPELSSVGPGTGPSESNVTLSTAPPATPATLPALTPTPPPAHALPPQHPPVPQNIQAAGNMNRVFKLQFDARRIICCSQAPIIVGWDFANGDEKIVDVSRFYAPVE